MRGSTWTGQGTNEDESRSHGQRGDRHPAAQRVRGRRRLVYDHIRVVSDHVRGSRRRPDDPREGRRRGTRRGRSGLGGQTLNINAEEENGKATGEFRVTDNVIRVDCADTDTDGVVILGGEATEGPDDVAAGDLLALIIREGDPDSVALRANDSGAASCTELLKAIPHDLLTDESDFVDVEDGYDIETG